MEQTQDTTLGPTLTEIWDLRHGRAPNRAQIDPEQLGLYRELILQLWDAYDDAQDKADHPPPHADPRIGLQTIGLDFDDPTTAVEKRWQQLSQMRAYAEVRLMSTLAGKVRPDRQALAGLPAILALLQSATDPLEAKLLLHQLTDDVSALGAADLLALTDMIQDMFAIPQTWLAEYKRSLRTPAIGATSTNGHAPAAPAPPTPAAQNQVITFLNSANMTDTGNAECLAHLYADQIRFCKNLARDSRWLTWAGYRWQIDPGDLVERFAIQTLRQRYASAPYHPIPDQQIKLARWALVSENVKGTDSMLQKAARVKPFLVDSILDFDRQPMLAACPNGTLDLTSGSLRAADRDDMLMMALGTRYDAAAACPRWQQFLLEIFQGDAELIAFVQRAVGYSLTGDTREQCIFFCFGDGANGKSVLLHVLNRLLGSYGNTTTYRTFEADIKGGAGEYLAALRAARLVTVFENNSESKLDESRIKAVSGGDPITCRHLYAPPFTYTPRFKIWMALNHKPVIRNVDHAIWRRIRSIPFLRTFTDADIDKTIEDKLLQELPGILNWALAGLAEWQRIGLGSCTAIDTATREYRNESDIVQQWLDDNVVLDPGTRDIIDPSRWQHEPSFLPSVQAYTDFKSWSKERGSDMSMTAWGRIMKSKKYETKRQRVSQITGGSSIITVYAGVRFRTNKD